MFDTLYRIQKIKQENDGITQTQIGEMLGYKKTAVSQYDILIENISANILDSAKKHQKGRAEFNSAMAEYDFNERWFRDSGLYK